MCSVFLTAVKKVIHLLKETTPRQISTCNDVGAFNILIRDHRAEK